MSLKLSSLPFHHYLPHLWARLEVLLLSAMTKMISIVCSVAQVIMRRDQHSLPLCYNFFIVETVLIDAIFILTALSISVTTASCMPLIIVNPTAQTVKPVTSILVGDNVTNNTSLLFFFDMCSPYAFHFYLSIHNFTCRDTRVTKHMLNMCLPHGRHAFTSYLQHVGHAVHACLHHFLILFKPVVSGCISLASH
jgi:hypothetical protein